MPTHAAHDLADHISSVLKSFSVDSRKLFVAICHDGAANMIKTSKLLKVDSYQHCTAHALHLLLTTDSINRNEDVLQILQKCRNIVTALHFKTAIIEDEAAFTEDKEMIKTLKEGMSSVCELLLVDDQFSVSIVDASESSTDAIVDSHTHNHKSVKASCPTRWNSTLTMIQSILDLKREVQNTIKRIGRVDICLHEDEIDFLSELVTFLKPFQDLTDLFSCSMPTLSTIPLVKMHIRKICTASNADDDKIRMIKLSVLNQLDHRFPVNDHIKLHQLLDPDSKSLIPRPEATTILENAIQSAMACGFIMSEADVSHSQLVSEDVSEESRCKRLRMELMNELRTEQSPNDCTDKVFYVNYWH